MNDAQGVDWCGAVAQQGRTLTLLGGCGKPIRGDRHAVHYGEGTDPVLYHPRHCPDTHDGTPVTKPRVRRVRQ
jgi:hypothetical protein